MGNVKPVVLDFSDPEIEHALDFIRGLHEQNKVSGMIFALTMRNDRQHPYLCGSAGRIARNHIEASGLSNMLQLKLTQEALDHALGVKR